MSVQEIVNQSTSWSKNGSATSSAINMCSEALGVSFPEEYVEFLLVSDGAEGSTPSTHPAGYFILFSTEKIVEINQVMEIQRKFPGHFAIGSNGSTELLLINSLSNKSEVLMVPELDDDTRYATIVGTTFTDFLAKISS